MRALTQTNGRVVHEARRDSGDLPGRDGGHHFRCGFCVLPKPFLGTVGDEYRIGLGVRGFLLAIPQALAVAVTYRDIVLKRS
jgi:hypothetical protein